jgi:hypothetical protein
MISKKENALLFDDTSMLEANFGKGFLNTISANANCDCTSYSELNDSDLHFDERSIIENVLGKDALRTTSINANCDCDG